jgi:5'-methylthioadenosine phosphorylase
MAKVGIIGGSGLDDPDIMKDAEEIVVDIAHGSVSSPLTVGQIDGVDVVLLARHGKQHQLSPTQVDYRANVQALKEQGVTHILATTACGSLREEIGRGDFVILDQFIDFTRHREVTSHHSFEDGAVHAAMADPFDASLRQVIYETSTALGFRTHQTGTVITIEGPRFSTRAESRMFRIWGADVINMSVATEAIHANEAEVPYAAVAMSTDYDSWKEDEEPVSWDEILEVFNKNADRMKQLIVDVVPKI